MKLRVALAGSFIGLACPTGAWAQEIPVALKGCFSSETTIIDKAGDVVFGMTVTRGVTDKTAGPASFPDKMMHDCRAVFTASKAGFEFTNRCNFVDDAGDKILSASSGTRDSFQWKWVAGTGKFEGITGGGTAKIDALYPRANPTVSGGCWSGKGTYSIKK
ncbi:MAG TPA: hypothetical protein VFO74_02140 [Pseudolabrys sp.]|nr:hypothetical protein [Pseudolabrys sp.]